MSRVLTKILLLFVCLGMALWAVPVAASPADQISVASSAEVTGDEIHLGEIAGIQAPKFAKQMLGDLSLGRSPKPGKVKVLTKGQVLSGLRRHQDLTAGMAVEIPDRIYIKRTGQEVSQEEIRLFIQESMENRFKGKEVVLERLEIPEIGQLPSGHVSISSADPPRIHAGGRFAVGLEIFVNGEKEDRIRVSGHVAVYERVVAAQHKMDRGMTLSAKAGTPVRKNIFSLKGEPVVHPDMLADMTLTRDVEKGEVILSDWLEPTPVIRKGDVVTLVAQKGGIMIRAMGVSREDGVKNSLIEVENIRSGKVIRGLVREPSTVEVVY